MTTVSNSVFHALHVGLRCIQAKSRTTLKPRNNNNNETQSKTAVLYVSYASRKIGERKQFFIPAAFFVRCSILEIFVSPGFSAGGGAGSHSFSRPVDWLLYLCSSFWGLSLLNCCILMSTLSFGLKPLSAVSPAAAAETTEWVETDDPASTLLLTTSCSASGQTGCVPPTAAALLDTDPPSLLLFLVLLSPLPVWLEGGCSALLGCLGSPGFLRTRFSSLEQRSTKSWSESSMMKSFFSL